MGKEKLRLAFMGTPDFAVPTLAALRKAGHEIIAVYSQPPSRAGRGKKERPSPVHRYALEHHIPVFTPKSLKSAEEQGKFRDLELDAAVVVAYGLLLPKEILDAPPLGCLNVHGSLLPRWRGAAPIHRAIMAGDAETGINIMLMDEGLDTGPVLLEKKLTLSPSDTTGDIHDRLMILGGEAIVPALEAYARGEIKAQAQPQNGVTYARKIDKAEAALDWTLPAREVIARIHGLSPFPGAWSMMDNTRIKFLRAEICDQSGPAGTVIDTPLTIACGDGKSVKILLAQRPGKSPMKADDLIRGFPIPVGSEFS